MIYDDLIGRAGLADIYDKVLAGQRLSLDDGQRLYACDELPVLGYLANIVRERKSGDTAYYVRNQHINYTNICNKLCKFCSFYVKPKDERGYVLAPEQVAARVAEYDQAPITEIHMVGGVNPKLPYQYYLDVLRAMKQARPAAHLKGLHHDRDRPDSAHRQKAAGGDLCRYEGGRAGVAARWWGRGL